MIARRRQFLGTCTAVNRLFFLSSNFSEHLKRIFLPFLLPNMAETKMPPLLVKTEKTMFMASEDNVLIKQITATHNPDGREFDVKPILQIVEDILNSATTSLADVKVRDALEDKAKAGDTSVLELLSYIINRLSCEISYKCMGGADGHSTSVSLLNMLSSYSWDAKLVLTLAAFALHYGEFWLLAQIYSTNRLASRMAILKQLPIITEHFAELKPRFEALNSLIQSILDLSKCVVCFRELPSNYISQDNQVFSTAVAAIPLAVYWIFRSLIACATNVTYLSGMGHEYTISTSEVWELSSLTHKTKTMNEHLQKQLATCQQFIEEKKHIEAYEALVHTFEAVHVDNLKILRSLINPKAAEILPLFDGNTRKRVALDVLRGKTVLLLISGLDISSDELAILEQIYNESRMQPSRPESLYNVVWVPVVEHSSLWTDATQQQFENLQATMPWYSVYHPSLIDRAVIRFIKENLHFKRKAILVVLDQQGKMVSPNALHMMWIWGSFAFPFTSVREEALWKEETWRLELLVDGIDPTIVEWIREGRYIILYGSDDVEWIRKFTSVARHVASDVRVPLEMVYVGKSTKKEHIRRVLEVISSEKISYVWLDYTMIWFFWTRLESMLFSKIELQGDDEKDLTMQEIKKLLSYDKTGPWALLSRGSEVILNGYGTTALAALQEYDTWKEHVPTIGFDFAFKDHYEKLHGVEHPCCRFEFETTVGRTPEIMKCPECRRIMEKFVTFSCCHD